MFGQTVDCNLVGLMLGGLSLPDHGGDYLVEGMIIHNSASISLVFSVPMSIRRSSACLCIEFCMTSPFCLEQLFVCKFVIKCQVCTRWKR